MRVFAFRKELIMKVKFTPVSILRGKKEYGEPIIGELVDEHERLVFIWDGKEEHRLKKKFGILEKNLDKVTRI
jgi:hypothetical protein